MANMTKRGYTRRTVEDRIAELQAKVEEARDRLEEKKRRDSPILRELTKVQRVLKKFSEVAIHNGRLDLSNSAQAFAVSIGRQSEPQAEEPKRRGRPSPIEASS